MTDVGNEFDAATTVTRDGDGWAVDVDPGWFVQNGPNGGYVASLLLRALVAAVDDAGRPPRSLTVHYLRPAVAGPAHVATEVTRAGRSLTFLTARLVQQDKVVAHAVAAFGTGRAELEFQDASPGEVPAAEELRAPHVPAEFLPPIARRLEYRPVDALELFGGAGSEYRAWIRLRDRRPLDEVLLATFVDGLPPALLFRATTPVLVPTVDLTIHFRRPPAVPGDDGWCLAHVRTRTASGGFVEEDCDVYDGAGTLLAQSRQLAIVVPLG